MEKIDHKIVPVNGLKMHIAELGQGPLVLFVHGFPELWYSWRNQMIFMAERGYRAVAPDLRGFGDTTGAPTDDPSKFSVPYIVGDLILLLEAISPDEEKVFVVGHDWGALIAWNLCVYRPDKVKALVNMSVPYAPRNKKYAPVDGFKAAFGQDYYICKFQEPGAIETEFANIGVHDVLKYFFAYRTPGALFFPKGFDYCAERPSWLSEEDLLYFVNKYKQTGFTGGVNYYRALNLTWELNAPWTGAQVKVPVKFIIGDLDLVYHMPGMKEYINGDGFKKDVPLLKEVVVMESVGHFINQERPDEINEHVYDFLKKF